MKDSVGFLRLKYGNLIFSIREVLKNFLLEKRKKKNSEEIILPPPIKSMDKVLKEVLAEYALKTEPEIEHLTSESEDEDKSVRPLSSVL